MSDDFETARVAQKRRENRHLVARKREIKIVSEDIVLKGLSATGKKKYARIVKLNNGNKYSYPAAGPN